MIDKPTSAADPRPNNRPAYIDPNCPDCGTPLVLRDALMRTPPEHVWFDEWWCRQCEEIVMDWPPGERAAMLGEEG